ncbi:MAG: 1-deoxy-D-xylulose-5-phosphate reductoisomerase [Clostridiales bacterium]|nr:1-deoxy-D-xylulose-5-phosphate reductoisomerase [Clostridiales bacterium]
MKTIAILGSTGSIGTQTLDVVRQHKDDFRVSALSAGNNIELLERQIREFHPALVSAGTEEKAKELRVLTADIDIEITYGMEGLLAVAAQKESDILVTAVVGMMGIRPTMAAIRAGKDIALANKETLVTAGHLIMPMAEEYGVQILPVDSEHSAIFQSWHGERACGNAIDKILLTASGGPFRGKKRADLETVTLEDALHHPNWSMGRKITVDSATMVNKGLEVMEAKWLFGVELDQIQVVVHPQSVIHSMVQYADGAVIAQLGTPDMRLPIQYALYYPERKYLNEERLDFYRLATLTFEQPDLETFQGLKLAVEAMKKGGNMPTVFNAANEKAVALFLDQKIRFLEIAELIGESMADAAFIENPDLEDILATEQAVYDRIAKVVAVNGGK